MPNEIIANEWFAKGEEDLMAAQTLLEESTTPNVICFLCQQIAEKYLKGFLVFWEQEIEKIHSIERLLEMCAKIKLEFNELAEPAAFLSTFYIQTRYPGDFPNFSFNDAKQALQSAKDIKEMVVSNCKL